MLSLSSLPMLANPPALFSDACDFFVHWTNEEEEEDKPVETEAPDTRKPGTSLVRIRSRVILIFKNL